MKLKEITSQSKQALILLLNRFLYAAILITTNQQPIPNAEPKTNAKTTTDTLMMSVGATPSSNYLKK
jgi:hypothetical protein